MISLEEVADRPLKDARVRQPCESVALGKKLQVGQQEPISLREVAGDYADGHVGEEPDDSARGQHLARRDLRVDNDADRKQHGREPGGAGADRRPGRQRGEDDRDVVEVAQPESWPLVEGEGDEDRNAAYGGCDQQGILICRIEL